MAVQTVTTNLNVDDIGFSFMGVASSTATGMRSLYGNLTWTAATLTASAAWVGLAYGDGYAVALNTAGLTNITLDNATTAWLSYGSIGTGTSWGQLAYGNGYFVSVNSSSSTAARMSLVYQTQWATTTLPSSTTWNLCRFGNGNFVAIATGTTSAAYSSDNGATWNPVTLPVSGTWTDIEYYNGKFILVGAGTQDILTSTDGTSWTRQTAILPASRNWAALAYITGGTNGTWIITTSDVANMAYSTDNGVSWTGSLMPSAANWKAVTGGKSGLRGQQMFIAAPQSAATGAFSTDGITWYSFTCTSFAWNKLMWCPSVWKSGIDTLTIVDGATVTVNTDQQRAWAGATLTNGKILVTNSSTTNPITFATAHAAAGAGVQSITPGSGLGSFEVAGNFISLGTSTGGSNQTFTSPYTRGDYIPALWVGSGSDISTYEIYVNVTGYQSNQKFSPMRNGINGVGSGDGGLCFTQDVNTAKTQYKFLTGVSCVANSNFVICDSTTGLVPGNKVVITGAGITVDTNAMIEQVLNSTTFTLSVVATGIAGTKYTSLVGVATPSIYEQFSTTLRFGDGVHGKIPPLNATIKVPNIMITDYTAATSRNAGWSSTDVPCYFVGTNAGIFKFNSCLLGESYANYTQAGLAEFINVGISYVPYVAECYSLKYQNVGFGSPPVIMYTTGATALGATGSCTGGNATITIPSSTAIRPGVLITGTSAGGLRPAIVNTVNSNTSLTLSQQAHTNASTQIYTYYGNFIERDYRYTQSTSVALFSTYTACQYAYVSNAIFDNCIFAFGGHPYAGNGGGAAQSTACIGLTYSNNVTITNVKVLRLGISQRNRLQESAFGIFTAGDTVNISGLKAFNISLADIQNASNITITSPRHRNGIFNEGYQFTNGFKSHYNPANETELSANTKYWYKTRTYWTHDIGYADGYSDGFAVCGAFKGVSENDHAPRIFGAVPQNIPSMSPSLAYGNSVWVGLATTGTVGGMAMVSSDNGATWSGAVLPPSIAPWWKVVFVGGAINKFFAFCGYQTGTAAAGGMIIASSTNGINWTRTTSVPAINWLRGMAYDANATTAQFVLVGSSSTGAAGTVAASSVDGSTWTARTQVSAITVAVASSGAGLFVAIPGGPAVGTASQYSTNGTTWAATTGTLASSLWQDIAYGNGKFVCISASSTTGPTAYCANPSTTVWTAGTAPTLPSGGNWQKILWTGSVFAIMSGCNESNYANAADAHFNKYIATSTDGITWSALKVLPDNTPWIAMANNGNAVMFVSTLTGRIAYTADVSAATPTWTFYKDKYMGAYNYLTWDRMDPTFTTAPTTLAAVATTAGSSTVTCTSTARVNPGTVLNINGFPSTSGLITASTAGRNSGIKVTGVTNATTFTVESNALFTQSSLTPDMYRHAYQIHRSTSASFTPSASTLIATTATSGTVNYQDADVTQGTPYYYKLRKCGKDVTIACSGTSGQYTITTAARFDRAITTVLVRGETGTNVLKFPTTPGTSDAWALGVQIGMPVTGTTGIPAGTVVTEIKDFNVVILNNNLTTNISQLVDTVYFGVFTGMSLFGTNVGAEAKISTVDSTTQITVDVANAYTFSAVNIQFYSYWDSPEVAGIPQVQKIVQNALLQNQTMATAPWSNSGCTVTAAADTCPTDLLFGANAVAGACSVLVTTANATNTQAVNLGIGSYTFSCFVRAVMPQIASSSTMGQVKLSSGSTTQTFDLTHKWQRISITFTSTGANPTENVVITWPTLGVLAYVGKPMLTAGSDLPPPMLTTTTARLFQSPQSLPTTAGVLGWNFEEDGSGIELNNTLSTSAFWYFIHCGTASNFTPSDSNQIYSNESAGTTEGILYVGASASTVSMSDYQPVSVASPMHAYPLYAVGGASKITIKDSSFYINGSLATPFVDSPAYTIYIHNCDFRNIRNNIAALYMDFATTLNSSKGLILQNCRCNRSRHAWAGQILSASYKGVFGARNGRTNTSIAWNFNTTPTVDGFPIASSAVYDGMFHELTFGNTGHGALHLSMIGSTDTVKPYTLSGTAYIDNAGKLYLQAVGDQAIIEWPHIIKGVTGFDKIMPVVHAVDLCSASDVIYGIVALIEYSLDKGSGYPTGGSEWTRLTGRPDLISAETGISATTGFRIKFRITARLGVKYTGRSSNFVAGETLQNASSSPTATMVLDEIQEEGSAIGTLIVSNVTGTWVTTNTIYSGATTRSTIVATNNEVFMPQATSYLTNLRVFTTTDTTKKYPFTVETLTIRVVDENLDPISGARVRVVATETAGGWTAGDLIYTGVTGVTGILTSTVETSASVDVSIRTRKSSSSPFYKPVDSPSTVALGSGINTTIVMIADE